MRTALCLVVFAALSCGEPQPWPMGFWEGEATLVHLETMTVTTSPISVESYYPGYMPGNGVDDPRFAFRGTLPGRPLRVDGQPDPIRPSTFSTNIDGGSFVAVGFLSGGATNRLIFDVSWSARDGGFDPAAPAIYTERAALRRLRDWEPSLR
jgi:hypothetical protein